MKKPLKSIEGYTIFVSNLPCEINEDEILSLFEKFGKITSFSFNKKFCKNYGLNSAFIQFLDL